MRSKLLATAALISAVAAAPTAEAEGLYFGLFGGVNFAQESDFDVDAGAGYSYSLDVEHDTGWAAGGAIGYGLPMGLRAEAEAGYRRNDFDKVKAGGLSADLDGDASVLSLMGNVWFDFPVTFVVRPFIGGGVGMAQVRVNDAEIQGTEVVDDDDWVFAYQLGGGIAYQVSPAIDVTAEYRYFATDEAELELEGGGADGEYGYGSHSVLIGLRYSFQ